MDESSGNNLSSGKALRWGILGSGTIARKFVDAVPRAVNSRVAAVAARGLGRAEAFAEESKAKLGYRPDAYGSYEELLDRPDIDVVYVATIHPAHHDCAMLALGKGKPLLVEKPFMMNQTQTREVLSLAEEKGLFVMEAMWTRFLPAFGQIREWIKDGLIGEPKLIQATYGYAGGEDRTRRHLNRELGGGALLDIGIYNLMLGGDIFGYQPVDLQASAVLDEVTGVDRSMSVQLFYGKDRGQSSQFTASVVTDLGSYASIYGTDGHIDLVQFYHPEAVVLMTNGGRQGRFIPDDVNGFQYQINEVERCLGEGLTESPLMTHEESLAWSGVIDRLLQMTGVRT